MAEKKKQQYRKITDLTIGELVGLVKAGLPINLAISAARQNKSTVYGWLKRGEEDFDAEADTLYSKLYVSLQAARAESAQRYLGYIRDAGERGQWQAAAWLLERMFAEQFAKIRPLDPSEREGGGSDDQDKGGVTFQFPDGVKPGS